MGKAKNAVEEEDDPYAHLLHESPNKLEAPQKESAR